jgi:uncharacterized glyoxalase superfamily protein PhnB
MKFTGICLITNNVAVLRDFYKEVLRVDADGDDTFTQILIDGRVFNIHSNVGMEKMSAGSTDNIGYGSCVIEFEVANVDYEYEYLKSRNVVIAKQPTTQPWGIRSVWFKDPDGNFINFYAYVK